MCVVFQLLFSAFLEVVLLYAEGIDSVSACPWDHLFDELTPAALRLEATHVQRGDIKLHQDDGGGRYSASLAPSFPF